jgi:hypothetical protein
MKADGDVAGPGELFRDFVQIGVVVRDLERAMAALSEIFGIGPFRTIDWPPPDRTDIRRLYYGQPREFRARMAFTELGPVELELIQPLDEQSIWADFMRERGEGIHHIRFNVADTAPVVDYLAGQGVQAAQMGSGLRPGTTWVNFDTASLIGFVIEVMSVVPGTDGRTPHMVNGKVLA